MNRRRKALMTVLSSVADTTAPTVVITSTASVLTAAPFTCTFTFSEDVTGFVVGDITVSANASAGTFNAVSGSVYTAVITPTSAGTVTVDVAANVCQDGAGNNNTAATQFSIVYGADAFTRADGAIGGGWTGATWTISSNAALNTPTLGAELLANPGFEGTYDTEAVGISVAPDWNNSGLDTGSDTAAESTDVHGGSKSQGIVIAAGGFEGVATAVNVLGANKWYQGSIWAKLISGLGIQYADTLVSAFNTSSIASGTWLQAFASGLALTARAVTAMGTGIGSNLVDDASVKELTLTSLFAYLPATVASVTAQVVVTVNPSDHAAGHILNLDSVSSPANFVVACIYGLAGGKTAKLFKCVAGTYTSVISGSITFNAAHNLKVVKSGDSYSLYYGASGSEAQVGTTQTITGMNGTIHGLFSTYPTAKFDTYSLSATP